MRINKKDCNVQLDYIKSNQFKDKVDLKITENGRWKNFYRGGTLIVSASTWRELYYQLVAFKEGIFIARLVKV